jgi:hypothetical protein
MSKPSPEGIPLSIGRGTLDSGIQESEETFLGKGDCWRLQKFEMLNRQEFDVSYHIADGQAQAFGNESHRPTNHVHGTMHEWSVIQHLA